MTSLVSKFAKEKIPILLDGYELSYYQEADCMGYVIADKKTKEQISRAIILSLNRPSQQINVVRFCPELCKQTQCKYLSAACFYLLVHHFATVYHLPKDYSICLETRPDIFERFYLKLIDFRLHVEWVELCKTAHVCGKYPHLDIDISKVEKKNLDNKEIPFLI